MFNRLVTGSSANVKILYIIIINLRSFSLPFSNGILLSVDVLLKATGDAPIMKKKKWAVEGEKPVGWVAEFIRKYLKLESSDTLVGLFICKLCKDI